jgi:hypothetical protein
MGFISPKSFLKVTDSVAGLLARVKEKELLRRNTKLYHRALNARERFQQATKILKQQNELDANNETVIAHLQKQRNKLKQASDKLATQVLDVAELIQINRDHPEEILKQLMDNEKVHKVENLEQLKNTRLGKDGDNKDCEVLMVKTNQGPIILAQIFRFHTVVRADEQGVLHPRDYPHELEILRDVVPETMSENVTHTGYYTVSSTWAGAAAYLVKTLDSEHPNLKEITISPIDSKAEEYNQKFGLSDLLNDPEVSDTEIRQRVFDLIYEKKNGVANFHLGNGASVGWIHINREANVHKIVINYVYDRKALKRNTAFLNIGNVPASEELCEELGEHYKLKVRDLGAKRAFPKPALAS